MANSFVTMDIDYIKDFLEIDPDDETYDDTIASLFPFYSVQVKKLLAVDTSSLTDEDKEFLLGVISAGIGCHLTIADKRFGMKQSGYKVGNVTNNFVRRYKTDYLSWCDYFEELLGDIMDFYGEEAEDSAQRPGVYDGYGDPY